MFYQELRGQGVAEKQGELHGKGIGLYTHPHYALHGITPVFCFLEATGGCGFGAGGTWNGHNTAGTVGHRGGVAEKAAGGCFVIFDGFFYKPLRSHCEMRIVEIAGVYPAAPFSKPSFFVCPAGTLPTCRDMGSSGWRVAVNARRRFDSG